MVVERVLTVRPGEPQAIPSRDELLLSWCLAYKETGSTRGTHTVVAWSGGGPMTVGFRCGSSFNPRVISDCTTSKSVNELLLSTGKGKKIWPDV